eukprot:m.139189 g.139189  ORF g.139189 m.139189 type:complete len:184 (-) comp24065_c0_seq6:68-619(-)
MLLKRIEINGVPNFDGKGGFRPVIRIYENYTDEIFASNESSEIPYFNINKDGHCVIPVGTAYGLILKGDVLVKCVHKRSTGLDQSVFRVQFHTCGIEDHQINLTKKELDDACRDRRFPSGCEVSFIFCESMGHEVPPETDVVKALRLIQKDPAEQFNGKVATAVVPNSSNRSNTKVSLTTSTM